MSWSVSAIGKGDAVRKEIARQFVAGAKCAEPEESVRQAAAVLIDASLAGCGPTCAVKVIASGSQSYKDWTTKTGVQNQLIVQVDPQWGFIE